MTRFHTGRAEREISYGKRISGTTDPDRFWGWGTPAGKIRAHRRAHLLTGEARLAPGKKVLEIGCGTGSFTEHFAKSGAEIVAVDISPDLISLAKQRNLPAECVKFLCVPFEESTLEGPFDAVIGSSVLHHLDLETSLRKIHELLKPEGLISFAEPNMLNPQIFIERKLRFLFPNVSSDETAFIRWTLKRKLLSVGFKNISVIPFDWLHPATPVPLITGVTRVAKRIEKIPLFKEFAGSLCIRAQCP